VPGFLYFCLTSLSIQGRIEQIKNFPF
jgi:hypothetical protein